MAKRTWRCGPINDFRSHAATGLRTRARLTAQWLALCLAACSGGSGGSGTVTENRSPVLVRAASDQQLITGHAFIYDASLGGTAVRDPDGDPLTYKLRVTLGSLQRGLSISGTVISGTPTQSDNCEIEVSVDDNRGGSTVFYRFFLRVAENSAPVVVSKNAPQVLTPGAPVNYDASQGGTTFNDPDGDSMTYRITLRGNSQGLAVSGTTVSGTIDEVRAVEVIIEASDGFGGIGRDSLLIAAAASPPASAPTLPETPYTYRDEELPLPFLHRLSSESGPPPLWDRQPSDNRTTNAGATLGRVLFYDKRMSITNTISCASCHEQAFGFSSPRRFDSGVLDVPLQRHTMALANARYTIQSGWFSDMRVREDLRQLVFLPIDSHDELGMAGFPVEEKLQNATFYPPLFSAAFGTPEISGNRIAAALAQFVQALISYQSKADRALNPMTNDASDPAAVYDDKEMRGLQLFTDSCSICHEMRAGTNVWQANNGLDSIPTDPGTLDEALNQGGFTGIFRAASLRNIAISSPYMHDGRFGTLREVIDHYDHGVQDSPDLDAILRDGPNGPRQLNLSEDDKLALEAFLNTFTDDAFLTDVKFSDPFSQ